MRFLILLFLFFIGCSDYIDYPDGFIKNAYFYYITQNFNLVKQGYIMDLEQEGINTKDELIEAAVVNYFSIDNNEVENAFRQDDKLNEYLIYVTPLCQDEPVLKGTKYESGMPIVLYNFEFPGRRRPIILVKGGDPNYWADSSYNGFTIIPVSDGTKNKDAELRFTYSDVKKVRKSEILEDDNEN